MPAYMPASMTRRCEAKRCAARPWGGGSSGLRRSPLPTPGRGCLRSPESSLRDCPEAPPLPGTGRPPGPGGPGSRSGWRWRARGPGRGPAGTPLSPALAQLQAGPQNPESGEDPAALPGPEPAWTEGQGLPCRKLNPQVPGEGLPGPGASPAGQSRRRSRLPAPLRRTAA